MAEVMGLSEAKAVKELVERAERMSGRKLRRVGYVRCPLLQELSIPGAFRRELKKLGIGHAAPGTLSLFPHGAPTEFWPRSLAAFQIESALFDAELVMLQRNSLGFRAGFAHVIHFFKEHRRGAPQFLRLMLDDGYDTHFCVLDHERRPRIVTLRMIKRSQFWEIECIPYEERTNELRSPGGRVIF